MNKFIETFESYPNNETAMLDLLDMLEEYKITLYGVELSRKSLSNIRKEFRLRGITL